jgi:hypothetical protein
MLAFCNLTLVWILVSQGAVLPLPLSIDAAKAGSNHHGQVKNRVPHLHWDNRAM